MKLQHTTTVRHLKSILKHGLLGSRSRGRLKVVWLHSPEMGPWACRHMMRRPGIDLDALVRLTVNVPTEWLRCRGEGLWYSVEDVPPESIISIARFGVIEEINVTKQGA